MCLLIWLQRLEHCIDVLAPIIDARSERQYACKREDTYNDTRNPCYKPSAFLKAPIAQKHSQG